MKEALYALGAAPRGLCVAGGGGGWVLTFLVNPPKAKDEGGPVCALLWPAVFIYQPALGSPATWSWECGW